jgi:hypothetical protein
MASSHVLFAIVIAFSIFFCPYCKAQINFDAPPNSLRNLSVGPKVKQQKNKGVGPHSLTRNTLRVGGHVGAPRWD